MSLDEISAGATPPLPFDEDPLVLVGRTLQRRYVVEAPIGYGGMARVYRARDLHLGDHCAIKVARSEAFAERLMRELRVGVRMRPPGTALVLDRGVLDHQRLHYLVFEFLDGETLADRLERSGTISWREAFGVGARVAEALARAHDIGVIHRDVSPHNIFLCRSGRVVLLDFGIAWVAGEQTLSQSGAVMGTPPYIAPEQALAPDTIDARADVYALGSVLYRAVAGREAMPMPPSLEEEDLARAATERRPLRSHVPDVSPQASGVVMRAIDPLRDGRFPTMRAFAAVLRICIGEEPEEELGVAEESPESAEVPEVQRRATVRPQRPVTVPPVLAALAGATGMFLGWLILDRAPSNVVDEPPAAQKEAAPETQSQPESRPPGTNAPGTNAPPVMPPVSPGDGTEEQPPHLKERPGDVVAVRKRPSKPKRRVDLVTEADAPAAVEPSLARNEFKGFWP